jgi:putative membrane protein
VRGRDVAVVIGALVLVILLVSLLGGGMMTGWGMMGPGMMGWGGFGFNPLGWIIMLLFWVLIIGGVVLLAVWLFREVTPAVAGPSVPTRSLEVLKERFARGEITREQYEEMRGVLEGR